jgi:hypothetical protein
MSFLFAAVFMFYGILKLFVCPAAATAPGLITIDWVLVPTIQIQ